MKQLLLISLLSVLFFGCNNGNTNKPIVTTANRSPELKLLRDAIAAHPDSLLLKEELIQYFSDNENYPTAMQETDAVLKKDSLNLRFLHIKAQLYYLAKDTPNSIKTYEKAIDIFPEPGDLMDLGTLYAATKNPKALELADALLLAKKANADKEALFLKGLYFNYTGDKQKAIIFFDDCLHLDYTFMFAYREKAIALYDLGKYNEALKVLNKATTLQNGFDEGYYWAGRCLEKLNRLSDAIDSYRMALQVAANNDDDNMEAREALARLGLKEQ